MREFKTLPYRAWVFDIDGTLLDSQAVLRPRTVLALEVLERAGAVLLVATALPQRYARVKLAAMPDLCRRGVFLGGGQIKDEPGGYIHEVRLEDATSVPVLSILESVSPDLQILVQYGDEHHALRLPLPPDLVATWGYEPEALWQYDAPADVACTKIVAWHDHLDLRGA